MIIEEVIANVVAMLRDHTQSDRMSIINGIGDSFCMLCGKDEDTNGKCYCAPGYDV